MLKFVFEKLWEPQNAYLTYIICIITLKIITFLPGYIQKLFLKCIIRTSRHQSPKSYNLKQLIKTLKSMSF